MLNRGVEFPINYFPTNLEKVPDFTLRRFDCVEEEECKTVYQQSRGPGGRTLNMGVF